MLPPAPLPFELLMISMVVVLFAGVVRGCAGFGFNALCVPALSLIVSPAKVVMSMFVLDAVGAASLAWSVRRDIEKRWLAWLLVGNLIGIPIGLMALAFLPEREVRMAISIVLLVAALSLRLGVRVALGEGNSPRMATGIISGLLNGVSGIGGLVAAVVLNTDQIAPHVMRATLVVFFFFTDIYAIAVAGAATLAHTTPAPLLSGDTVVWALWLAPAMLLGIAIGQRIFKNISPATFRRQVLNLLILVASLTLARSILG